MRPLIIHPEAHYFGGAEKMLGYFLQGCQSSGVDPTVALVKGSGTEETTPQPVKRLYIPSNPKFSPAGLRRQLSALREAIRRDSFDVLHGWAARDWELTALAGILNGRPTVGTLHDHPRAWYISRKRQHLMRWCARWGLRKVICVSEAVRRACQEASYPADKALVIHNGLPTGPADAPRHRSGAFRLGFLAAFTELKGLRDLFGILERLAALSREPWEMFIAGGVQDQAGERLLAEIRGQYATADWWSRVHWQGWVKQPLDFLQSIDLLLFPSKEFDSFPTVLLEAGRAGIPVVASRVGGVPEIVVAEQTGWLFEPEQRQQAAEVLASLLSVPERAYAVGQVARQRMNDHFSVAEMVAAYGKLYSTLARSEF